MKKKYIKPVSELIQVKAESLLVRASGYNLSNKKNWLNNKENQVEYSSDDMGWTAAPKTWGDHAVDPGGDIDIGSKVNPWNSWDDE